MFWFPQVSERSRQYEVATAFVGLKADYVLTKLSRKIPIREFVS